MRWYGYLLAVLAPAAIPAFVIAVNALLGQASWELARHLGLVTLVGLVATVIIALVAGGDHSGGTAGGDLGGDGGGL